MTKSIAYAAAHRPFFSNVFQTPIDNYLGDAKTGRVGEGLQFALCTRFLEAKDTETRQRIESYLGCKPISNEVESARERLGIR